MKDQTLYFLYEGGDACRDGKYERQTLLTMRCGPTLGAPVFLQETPECQFQFEWVTSAACGVGFAPDPEACVAYDATNEIEYDLSDLRIDLPWTTTYGDRGGGGTFTYSLSVCQPLPSSVACVAQDPGGPGAKIGACLVQNFIGTPNKYPLHFLSIFFIRSHIFLKPTPTYFFHPYPQPRKGW
ncbi:hypothetical protein SARC_08115 [Sphaeroforma arctica JP610]|uniref:MRH domain-containing protein n=1 Tax=Sphaeroforma arctica JP610 TaxID=667725 RepID=A0A0L0FS13_9EUKA|nr:hypothetical protein SARC_08115 [Sphaeroforma arctica JP610]KNC79494.1 hypothetical protein SARC_08115 [Sphaeroforma arctica JP610]|eukprot:XP_014153396.1 hypothetical protein SARC_08115 [Sphaeroforma arctica JP610]